MKRLALILAVIAPFLLGSLTGCEKIPDGTGTLVVHITYLEYDTEVRVYPYGITTFNLPIASQDVLKGPNRSVTFTLNAGDYIVDATGTQSVQIQAGKESHLYFD
mgnify:FL=1